jgi:N-formylglutamate amidohydrolase
MRNLCIFSHLVRLVFILVVSTNQILVLNPYYKMDYITMQWGSPEEQVNKRAAGNPNTVNWQDEAMKIVETAMEEYWEEAAKVAVKLAHAGESEISAQISASTVKSDFDRHQHQLMERANRTGTTSTIGWPAELHRYLRDLPCDVSENMDVVKWWSVSDYLYTINSFTH